ncbi:hypothetical protein ACFFK0_12045 [Paenibacillus chartarius]|uniref:Uncharacterized protein n=1 Tax=Paenibacillus chartarius TaxID=747481 RepID=A0ABV6DKQ3_9BACL
MYNQQFGSNIGSQYQGFQRQYQPVGQVQSFYGQSQGQQQQYGSYPSSDSYHTANYRGNQLGHDAGLRGDSFTPAQQQQFGGQTATNYGSFAYGVRGNEQAYTGQNNVQSQFGFNSPFGTQSRSFGQIGTSFNQGTAINQASSFGQQYGSYPSSESYHTANYRGNQLGHDAGLRGDSFTPAQQQQFGGQSNVNYGSFAYGVRGNEQAYSGQNNVQSQFGFNNAF